MICNYWFFNHEIKFQNYVCNGCHDLTTLFVDIGGIEIVTIKMLIIVAIVIKLADTKQLIY